MTPTDGLLAGDLREGSAFRDVPEVDVFEAGDGSARTESHRGVHVEFERGGLMLLEDASAARVTGAMGYGLALLPPLPADDADAPGPVVLVSSPDAEYAIEVGAGELRLVPLDATVTLRDARTGSVIPGWDARRVNEDVTGRPADGGDPSGVMLVLKGPHVGTLLAGLLAASPGASELGLGLAPSGDPRLGEALDGIARLQSALGGAAGAPPQDALDRIAALSPLLDGALLLVRTDPEGDAAAAAELVLDGVAGEAAGFTMLRVASLDLALASDGTARLSGEAHLAMAGSRFATQDVAAVASIVPYVSVLLWAVAVALVVLRFVRRPKADEVKAGVLRPVGFAAHVLALLVAFLVWDASFASAFGTSVLRLVSSGSLDPGALGLVAALELAPFSIASLAFAMPVRIAAGVALRYTGRHKGWAGFAKAAGHLVLAVLGPAYALFFLNGTVMRALAAALPGAG